MNTNCKCDLITKDLLGQDRNMKKTFCEQEIKCISTYEKYRCFMCALFITVIFVIILIASTNVLSIKQVVQSFDVANVENFGECQVKSQTNTERPIMYQLKKSLPASSTNTEDSSLPVITEKSTVPKGLEKVAASDGISLLKSSDVRPSLGLLGQSEESGESVQDEYVATAYDLNKSEMKGFKYIHLSEDTVKLFIENEGVADVDKFLKVPSIIYDSASKKLKVVEIGKISDRFDIKQVVFINGFEDLTIDDMLFEDSALEKVVFESAIKKLCIGHSAFRNCKNLKGFEIPESVSSLMIGNMAFYGCSQMMKFTLKEHSQLKSLTIGYMAFCMCDQLLSFPVEFCKVLEDFIAGDSAFRECVRLTEFKFPPDIKKLTIDKRMFYHCIGLNKVELPMNLLDLTIDCMAFSGCIGITSFEIPKKVLNMHIGYGAFSECTGIVVFEVPKSVVKLYIEEIAFSKTGMTNFVIEKDSQMKSLNLGKDLFNECAGITGFEVPASVQKFEIGSGAFCKTKLMCFTIAGISKLKSFVVGCGAFKRCDFLTNLQIPASVEDLQIESQAFSKSALQKFSFENGSQLKSLRIGKEAFSECEELTEFEIPDKVKNLQIGILAFSKCSALKNFLVKDKSQLENLIIGAGAFNKCICIPSIVIPASVVDLDVGRLAFSDCRQLMAFTVDADSKLKYLFFGSRAFRNTRVIKLEVPKSVEDLVIDDDAFRGYAIESFKIKSDSQLKSLSIGKSAFESSGVTSFEVPSSVKDLEIEECVFSNSALENFIIRANSQLDKLHIGNRAFVNTLITNFEVPASVKDLDVGEYAFSEGKIESFTVKPDSILESVIIGNFAFNKCLMLVSFNMRNCSNLKRILIGQKAFHACYSLLPNNFVLPKSVSQKIIFNNSFDEAVPDSLKDSTLYELYREDSILVWNITSSKSLKIILDKKLYDMIKFTRSFVDMWDVEIIEIRKNFLEDVDIFVDLGDDMKDFILSDDMIYDRYLIGDYSQDISGYEEYYDFYDD